METGSTFSKCLVVATTRKDTKISGIGFDYLTDVID